MIRSMTGFGRGRAAVHGYEVTVELRSVNKRFFETSLRVPSSLGTRESAITSRLKEAFDRGRISGQVKLGEGEEGTSIPVEVDEAATRGYAAELQRLRTVADIQEPVRLDHLLQFSDVLKRREADDETEADEAAWPAVQAALEDAIDALRAMQEQEGAALLADLQGRMDAIETALEKVERLAPERAEAHRERLRTRITDLLDGRTELDEGRLEQEVAFLADKSDVTEECVRLRSHLALFREALANDEATVGRKLNFIVQEVNREVNTIGSKANDAEMQHLAVAMKEEVEKVREQVQNVA